MRPAAHEDHLAALPYHPWDRKLGHPTIASPPNHEVAVQVIVTFNRQFSGSSSKGVKAPDNTPPSDGFQS